LRKRITTIDTIVDVKPADLHTNFAELGGLVTRDHELCTFGHKFKTTRTIRPQDCQALHIRNLNARCKYDHGLRGWDASSNTSPVAFEFIRAMLRQFSRLEA
jgi:hypothetical protein